MEGNEAVAGAEGNAAEEEEAGQPGLVRFEGWGLDTRIR